MRTMRWDCSKKGCFNRMQRIDLFRFDHCFPGKIGFTDLDGIVEINGKFLIIEWKSHRSDLPTGQRIMFERLTNSDDFMVCVVDGDAEKTIVRGVRWVRNGLVTEWADCDLRNLEKRFTKWARWAKSSTGTR